MINPVSHQVSAFEQSPQLQATKRQSPQANSGTQVQDQVTLKNTGHADNDGDKQ